MKKYLLFLLVTLFSANLFAQDGVKFKYAWKTYFIQPDKGVVSDNKKEITFSNEDIDVTVYPIKLSGAGFESFNVLVSNKTDNKVSISIDESSYIMDGNSVPVADSHILRININNPQPIWVLPPHSKSEKQLCQRFIDQIDIKNFGDIEKGGIFLSYTIGEKKKDVTNTFSIIKAEKKK